MAELDMPYSSELADAGAFYDGHRLEPITCFQCGLIFNYKDIVEEAEYHKTEFRSAAFKYHNRFHPSCEHLQETRTFSDYDHLIGMCKSYAELFAV